MKKSAFAVITTLALTAVVIAAAMPTATVQLHRLVNDKGEHFYTASTVEKDRVIKVDGYRDEGVVGYIWATQVSGTDALHRLYRGSKGIRDHFYTVDIAEKQRVEDRDGYKEEGITGYISKTQLPGTVPLYRLFSERYGEHFYTISDKERESAEKNDGFKGESIVGYIVPPPPAEAVKPAIFRDRLPQK